MSKHAIWLLTYPAHYQPITETGINRVFQTRECYSTRLDDAARCALVHLANLADENDVKLLCGSLRIPEYRAEPFAKNKVARNTLVHHVAFKTLVQHKANGNPNYFQWPENAVPGLLTVVAPPEPRKIIPAKARQIWLIRYAASVASITDKTVNNYGLIKASECYTTKLDAQTKCTLLHLTVRAADTAIKRFLVFVSVQGTIEASFTKDKQGLQNLRDHAVFTAFTQHKTDQNPELEQWCEQGITGLLSSVHPALPRKRKITSQPSGQPPAKKGPAKCIHGRRKNLCKPCGGIGICTHGNIKYRCRECKGKAICSHGHLKYYCAACNPCPHKRTKRNCAACNPRLVCKHKLLRAACKTCNARRNCSHDRVRALCIQCKEKKTCVHNKLKRCCQECKAAKLTKRNARTICAHGNYSRRCQECKAVRLAARQICEHGNCPRKCKACKAASAVNHENRVFLEDQQ
jgi:hypothetical protein